MTAPKVCTCPRARHKHGTSASHITCGCQCLPCRTAYVRMVQRRRHGHKNPRVYGDRNAWLGVKRRIEALHAIGYTGKQLSDEMGVSQDRIYKLRTQKRGLYPATIQQVSDLFDSLWDKPYVGPGSKRTRIWAEREGFAVPAAWDDIDDPAEKPKHQLTKHQAQHQRRYARGQKRWTA